MISSLGKQTKQITKTKKQQQQQQNKKKHTHKNQNKKRRKKGKYDKLYNCAYLTLSDTITTAQIQIALETCILLHCYD